MGMEKQGLNTLGALSKDEQIVYLLDLATSLELKIDILAKDNDALAKDNAALEKDNITIKEQSDYYKGELNKLIEQIKLDNARYWGAKTERVKPYQISLFNDMEAAAGFSKGEPDIEVVLPKKRRKKKTAIDYSSFETTVIEYELSEDERICSACSKAMDTMGIEIKRTIRLIPARLVCEEHRRHVYACKSCSDKNAKDAITPVEIIKAKMPIFPLEKSCATPSLLSHILHQKYSLAQPVYRISEDMRRSCGLTLSRQTLGSWVIRSYERWLALLYALMKKKLLERDLLFVDETQVQVLKEPDRSPSSRSYMWLFASAKAGMPIYIFEYHPSRARSVVADFLVGWSGTIIADGYSVYDDLGDKIVRLSCIVHIRRYFANIVKGLGKEALESLPGAVSVVALKKLDEIIHIDNTFDDMDVEKRREARLRELKPKMDIFYAWCIEKREEALPSMALAKALNYSIAQWPKLNNVFADGRFPIDNNFSERSIRPFAIGRRNWLFSDTQRGAHASAAIYSIITTAKGNSLKPREYLEWLFEKMPNTENLKDESVLEKFLPWSDEIPEFCRISAQGATASANPLDEPIIDIDPNTLE